MKTLLSATILLYMLLSTVQAQSIEVKSSLNSSVETKDDIVMSGPEIVLNNVNLSCNKLTIKKTVSKIKVTGTVKIDCRYLDFEADPTSIDLDRSTGVFFIEYSDNFVSTNRKFKIDNAEDLKMNFSKKIARR